MGGDQLNRADRRALGTALAVALILILPGCAHRGFRNHRVPTFAAPASGKASDSDDPTRLREEDTVLLRGGLRIIRADVARPTPEFSFVDQSGVVHTPESLRDRVVWVDLWAVWCGTCRAEFPFVQALHERLSDNGLTVLAVCRNSKQSGFQAATQKPWLDFPVVDASDDSDFPFPYHAFPTSVLIDRDGRIRAYWQGHRSPEAIEDAVRHLLAEPRASEPVVETNGRTLPLAGLAGETAPIGSTENVLRADLELPRESVPAGGYFEGLITLDVDPGWHLNADPSEGLVPLDIRFDSEQGFQALGHHLPVPRSVATAFGPHEGYTGVLRLPVWGVLDGRLSPGQSVPLTIVASVQACDRTTCLPPAEIVLANHLWVGEPEPPAGAEPEASMNSTGGWSP